MSRPGEPQRRTPTRGMVERPCATVESGLPTNAAPATKPKRFRRLIHPSTPGDLTRRCDGWNRRLPSVTRAPPHHLPGLARSPGRYSAAAGPAPGDPGGPPLIGKATNRPSHQRNVAEDTMPVINRVADLQKEVTAWRRDLHENPEILYEVHRTAGIVADKLKEFGCDEVVT